MWAGNDEMLHLLGSAKELGRDEVWQEVERALRAEGQEAGEGKERHGKGTEAK